MANVAEVIFKGTDETSPVARRVAQNLKQTSAEMKGLGMAFSQASAIANQFGNTAIASVVGQLDNAVMSMSMLTKEVTKSKAGFVALAAAVTAGGYAIGNSIRQYIPFFNEPDKLAEAAKTLKEAGTVARSVTALRDPRRAALDGQQVATQERIDEIRKGGTLTPEQEELVFQLERFKTEALQKGIEDREELETQAGMKLALRQQEYGIQAIAIENEFTGQKMAVRQWESEQRRQIDDMELVNEEAKNNAKVELAKAAAAKINEINQQAKAAESARWKGQLAAVAAYASGAGSALGQLASAMEAGSKKQFKTAQALRIGEAIMNTAAGIARCYADYPLWLAIPMSAIVAAAGAVQIGVISKQKGPQAHSGLDYVPQEATYKLSRGEMVLDPGTSEAVRRAAIGGAGGGSYQLNIDVGGESLARLLLRMSRDGRLEISSKAVTS